MKIKDCVIINKQDLIREIENLKLFLDNGCNSIYDPKMIQYKISALEFGLGMTKPLEDVIRDAMNKIITHKNEIDHYINKTEI